MAGGPFAREIMCLVCAEDRRMIKATRVREGQETDQYKCSRGHEFGLDWPDGPATGPQWPPPPEVYAILEAEES